MTVESKEYYCGKCGHKHRISSGVGRKHYKMIRGTSGIIWLDKNTAMMGLGESQNGTPKRAYITVLKMGEKYQYSVNFDIWDSDNDRWLNYTHKTYTLDERDQKEIYRLIRNFGELI